MNSNNVVLSKKKKKIEQFYKCIGNIFNIILRHYSNVISCVCNIYEKLVPFGMVFVIDSNGLRI